MGIDISALTTNADKLDECIGENEKQERKDKQLYDAIERKVKKEEHRREKPRGQDGTLKKCKRLFKEGASPEVLTKLEESLRKIEQEKYYRYYVQCFLPVLNRKISKELDPIKKEKIGQVISNIIRESGNHNHYTRRDSQDSGIGSDNNDERQTDNKNINYCLLEAAKRGNRTKIKKCVQEGADISVKDSDNNNALHHIISPKEKQIASFEGKHKVTCLKLILKLSQDNTPLKAQLREAVNAKNREGQTPLQKLLFSKITKGEHGSESVSGKFGKFLKRPFTEYDDHTIESAIRLFELGAKVDDLQLSKEELQNLEEYRGYYLKFLEKLAESVKKPELKQEIKTQIKEIIAHTINTPDSNSNYQLHLAIKNNEKKIFEELLQKGTDISLKDAEQNNALHHIASLKGEHKITYLKLILRFEKEGIISSEKLHEAINAKNKDERYPTQVALIRQAENIRSKLKDFSRCIRPRPMKYYYTARFCTMLLQNGAKNKSDPITIEKYDSEKYYHTKERIKDLTGISPNPEIEEAINQRFSKKCGKNIDLPVKWILGGLIFATVFSTLAGNMIVAAALSVTIAVCAMCYPVYLKLENALNARNSVAQKPSDQPEHTESPPNSKIIDLSITGLIRCLGLSAG